MLLILHLGFEKEMKYVMPFMTLFGISVIILMDSKFARYYCSSFEYAILKISGLSFYVEAVCFLSFLV